ncbi:DivIVA domain-containing protein [Desulfotomaculum sp. 1211_IL3151]|uniref:DivIVA domain-containing protein n=1 Tax=Desulfotomaculum sp. 1211_IL3151 TaxID=3084055 RepID=UPI002FD9F522
MSYLTPMEIQAKGFDKAIRGYDTKQVDAWMLKIKDNYEKIYVENHELKEQLSQSQESIVHYRDLEDALQRTLVMAQKSAEDMKKNAEREAKILLEQAEFSARTMTQQAEAESERIVKEASHRAEEMLKLAETRVEAILLEYRQLEKQAKVFRAKFRALLEAQMELMEGKVQAVEEESVS